MDTSTAQQIADLINKRNQLTKAYTAELVLKAAANYVCILAEDQSLQGVVEVKRVQWYQCEIDHLSVQQDGRGTGTLLLRLAETRVMELGARIAQCTIRVGNAPSEGLFKKFAYLPTVTFFNQVSGNDVTVYQKALAHRVVS